MLSSELNDELKFTILKPKLRRYFRGDGLTHMLDVFDPYVDYVDVNSSVLKCRDPKDDFLLALAKDGKADFLLTGDYDLLEVGQFGKTVILTINQFYKIVGS